jgi:type I restriction enzyme S subunit
MFQQPYLITQTSGGAQSNISQTIVRKTLVPLPPLKEQKRIVAKINELLDDLETGKTKLETALAKLKTYRQSVLKEAFEGRLINKQLKRSELPIGWQALRFKEIGKLVSGQHILKMDYDYSKKGIPYLTGPADFGIQNPIITKWTTKPKVIANKNDVLITVKGSGVGKINLLNIDTAAIGRQLMALSSNQIESRFLFLYLQSQFEKFQSLGSGSSIPGIDRNTILNFIIPIPPLKTQVEVVKEIESRFSNCDRMEKITIERIKQIGSLRQSILQNAFEGKLVEQNPSDEPVELLIGKIKREKEIFLAEEKIKRKKSPKNFKINMMTKKLETIIHLLQKNKKPISSRTLWKSSEHSDDIDAFYAQLKKHVDKGEIKEIRKGKDSFLTIAK